jgi:hypothetical protein
MWFGILLSVLVLLRVCSFSGVSVGLKTFDCSFAFDLSELIAPLGLHARRTRLFSHALLNIQKMGGAQAFTRERITMPFSSLRSDSGTDIVSRSARSLCKPAGCSVRFGFI